MFSDKNNKVYLWQPGRVDRHSKWHLILACIGVIACAFNLVWLARLTNATLNDVFVLVVSVLLMNFVGVVYDYGQATGWQSEEGIDPADLLFNLAGTIIGSAIWWRYGAAVVGWLS